MLRKDACANLVHSPWYRTYLFETEERLFQAGCYCGEEEADRENRSFALSISLVDDHFGLDRSSASQHVLGITNRVHKVNLMNSV